MSASVYGSPVEDTADHDRDRPCVWIGAEVHRWGVLYGAEPVRDGEVSGSEKVEILCKLRMFFFCR